MIWICERCSRPREEQEIDGVGVGFDFGLVGRVDSGSAFALVRLVKMPSIAPTKA